MKKEKVEIVVSRDAYPLEAVYSAAYVFVDCVYVYLAPRGKNGVAVRLTAKSGTSGKQLENIAGEFQNELLNASLRVSLAKENKKIRQQIVERALFSSIGEEEMWGNEADVAEIAETWEEKGAGQ